MIAWVNEAVISYIKHHCSEPIRLEDLAVMANFSKYHFSRIFTAVRGISPMALVTRMRLQKAVWLLLESGRPSLPGVFHEQSI
ncbi:helix-turn-helix domain-containing protein [Peribacillus sp. SCS-37]|uniref:helix-turn-helix domain-containing protein n=1 Tax=Paraperibacillus esterisolvens TaxID=3115296 RepID=UPI003906807F